MFFLVRKPFPVAEDVPAVVRCVGFAIRHLSFIRIFNTFLLPKQYFQLLSGCGILLPDGIDRPRRETEEGWRNHHALFSCVSRPCRDAVPLVVSSRHCEDFVLLYRVMQGLVPDGTNRHFFTISLGASCKRRLLTDCIRFWKSEK